MLPEYFHGKLSYKVRIARKVNRRRDIDCRAGIDKATVKRDLQAVAICARPVRRRSPALDAPQAVAPQVGKASKLVREQGGQGCQTVA